MNERVMYDAILLLLLHNFEPTWKSYGRILLGRTLYLKAFPDFAPQISVIAISSDDDLKGAQ